MNTENQPYRTTRSYVRREGRITRAQQQALEVLLPHYGLAAGQPVDWLKTFGRRAPRTMEIGFGNGTSLAAMAEQEPESDFLGIEVHRPGVGHLLLELERRRLSNVRVIHADAVTVIERCIPEQSLDRVLLFFPDPWPKKRHHKRRIVQPDFIGRVGHTLAIGGTLHLATDWEDYARYMLVVMNTAVEFRNSAGKGRFSPRPVSRPLTKFEHRGRQLGHGVWDLVFEKI